MKIPKKSLQTPRTMIPISYIMSFSSRTTYVFLEAL